MRKCKLCGSYQYVIVCETRFGHGDSSTNIYCKCDNCNNQSQTHSQYGFPAEMILMRKAQKDYLDNNTIND